MKIQFYATKNCSRCQQFKVNLMEAIKKLNLDDEIEEIDVIEAISKGIKSSPSIIIDDEIKSSGEVLSVDELKKIAQREYIKLLRFEN